MSFEFDFSTTQLSSASRQQLRNITKAVKPGTKAAESRSALLRFIVDHRYDPTKGFYVPLSDDVWLRGLLPIHSSLVGPTDFPSAPFPHCYFTNALSIPAGYGTEEFDPDALPAPKHRVTNVGFMVVTIEYDCPTTEDMEECLGWTRGGNGEFSKSRFAEVDRALCAFKEYRGYTIVFSGNRSLHFHLIFSTKHLEKAPWDCSADERLTRPHASILHEAHRTYWEAAAEAFDSVLNPCLAPDTSLRSLTHWRRASWAIRKLKEKSVVLGLPAGTLIPQLVINEHIRTRASTKGQDFLVPPDLRATNAQRTRSRSHKAPTQPFSNDFLLERLLESCREEWGEYPQPATVRRDGGEWVINFRNNANDRNPSTVVKGQHRRLMINGARSLTDDFYLPWAMSADELCNALTNDGDEAASNGRSACLRSVGIPKSVDLYVDGIHHRFAQPVSADGSQQTTSQIRERLRGAISDARVFERDLLIRSPEGAGKTSKLFDEIALEILDAALSRPLDQHRFACFAFRSTEQAEAKAQEYRNSGKYRKAVVLRSFWDHYRAACTMAGSEPILRHEFPDHSLNGVLRQIRSKQPSVFESLEECRLSLWVSSDGKSLFDSAMTVLFTNHDLAKTWYRNRNTRLWHSPEFQPFANQEHERMRKDLAISHIVFDEPEIDTLLHELPEWLFLWLERTQRRFTGWGNRSRSERHQIYRAERQAGEIRHDLQFEEIDELLRLNLREFEARDVNYDALPFGCDQPGRGIYSAQNGKRFYLGVQGWLKESKAQLTFLTTEALVSEVLTRILDREQSKRDLIVLDLHTSCESLPYPGASCDR